MPRVVIVGAGISGLAVAYRLQQTLPSAEITVLERNVRPGGTVHTVQRDGFRIEEGPNGFLDSKPTTLELCRELGLAEQLVTGSEVAARNRYLFLGERLKLLPSSFGSFVRSDVLSWRGKLSLLMERLRPKGTQAEDESIEAFARRRAGNEVANTLADALVTGIYAGDPSLLSVRATFPRLAQLGQNHGSIIKGMAKSARQRRQEARDKGERPQRSGKLWSFQQGLSLLIDTLCVKLTRPPELNVAVQAIQPASTETGPVWNVVSVDGRRWMADAVVLACPAYQQAQIIAGCDAELSRLIGEIPYNRIAVVGLGYRRADVPVSLDGFGFIAPQRSRRDILGVQWCSSVYPGRAPEDAVLLRAMCGGWHRAELVDWDDAQLLEAVRKELQLAMQITAEPICTHIVRWHRAIPQYHLGHLHRVEQIEQQLTHHPGLFVGGNAYLGVALNDCTEQGAIIAGRVRDYLAARPS
jgi:oxygen-dependent protoporphyrinogen oxidase